MTIEALIILVPVIIGLVGVITSVGIPSKLAPLLSVVLGVCLVMMYSNSHSLTTILVGLMTGLAATGTHSGVTSTVNSLKAPTVAQ